MIDNYGFFYFWFLTFANFPAPTTIAELLQFAAIFTQNLDFSVWTVITEVMFRRVEPHAW